MKENIKDVIKEDSNDDLDFDLDFDLDLDLDLEDNEKEKKEERICDGILSEDNKAFVGEKLQEIKKYEQKLKEDLKFDLDPHYFFSIVFKSTEERNKFLRKYKLKLTNYDHICFDEIKHIFKDKI